MAGVVAEWWSCHKAKKGTIPAKTNGKFNPADGEFHSVRTRAAAAVRERKMEMSRRHYAHDGPLFAEDGR